MISSRNVVVMGGGGKKGEGTRGRETAFETRENCSKSSLEKGKKFPKVRRSVI